MGNLGRARIKAKAKKGTVGVKMMGKHPQLSHQEAKRAKKDADWITQVTATVDGKTVYEVSASQFLSKNPYFKFAFNDADYKGKQLEVTMATLLGEKKTFKAKIK
jgi:sulfur-oxidizing protein SoxZ